MVSQELDTDFEVRTYFSTFALAILTSMTSVQQLSALFENIIFAAFVQRLF